METAKDIFFFIGSLLGILAFFKNLVEPALDSNKEKWEKVQKHLTEEDLRNLEYSIDMQQRVEVALLNKLYSFITDIKKDAEYLRLGPPFEGRFDKRKKKIAELYWQLREYIQDPYWTEKKKGNSLKPRIWFFNKDHFYKNSDNPGKEYGRHLKEAREIAEEIRRHYRAISFLANLKMIEAPTAIFKVNKRSTLPIDAT